jgi:FdhD protein
MSVVLNAPEAPPLPKPYITRARAPLTRSVTVHNEFGEVSETQIPAERALTIYLDKKELVTLMTLGAEPEWLVLGFLRNQRLIDSLDDWRRRTGRARRGRRQNPRQCPGGD